MELKPYLENLKDSLLRAYDLLVARGFITDEVLRRYSELNLHSILQHCLIVSADKSGLVALPEYKIALGVPIDRYAIDDRYRGRRARYVRRIRVDVAYFLDRRLVGVGEVYTPDEIHGCVPSRELEENHPWLTPYHKLLHLAKHRSSIRAPRGAGVEHDLEFVVVINVFSRLPPWPRAKRRSLEEWVRLWNELISSLRREVTVVHFVIRGLKDVSVTW